jgi:hypothetical protein
MSLYYIRVGGRLVRTGILPDSAITLAATDIYAISSSLASSIRNLNSSMISSDGTLSSTNAVEDTRITSLEVGITGSNARITSLEAETSCKNVVYVAENGSDLSVSGSMNSPFLTVQAAVNYIESKRPSVYSITDHVVINIAPGSYSGNVTVTKPYIHFQGAGYNKNSKATTLNGLINISNTVNPVGGGGVSNTVVGLYNMLISAPITETGSVVSFAGTGQATIVLDTLYVTARGLNTSALFVSKSLADNSSRLKVENCIFGTDGGSSLGPTVDITNIYSTFVHSEIGYNITSSGVALKVRDTSVEFGQGGLISTNAATGTGVFITSSNPLAPFVLSETAVVVSSTSTTAIRLTPNANIISARNGYSVASGSTNFVISGSVNSYYTSAFDSTISTYCRRISALYNTPGSASFVRV